MKANNTTKPPEALFDNCLHLYFKAIQQNKIDEVKSIFKILEEANIPNLKGKNVVNHLIQNKSGDIATHLCARLGFLTLIKYLVEEKSANLEQVNLDGKTALHDAAQFSSFEVVKYLLEKGANVNVVKRADWTPLMLACTKQDLAVINILLEYNANVFFVNKDGWNCIHLCARQGNFEMILMILTYVKNPDDRHKLNNARSRNGRKPLHTAVMHGHFEVTKLLVEKSSIEQANESDHCGTTPLMEACRFGFLDLIYYLKENIQADLTKCNKQGLNCLHIASEAGQSEVIKVLVEKYKMDINLKTEPLKMTPLHWAAKEGQTNAVKTLIEYGADTDIVDLNGRTSLDVADLFKHPEVVDLIKKLH